MRVPAACVVFVAVWWLGTLCVLLGPHHGVLAQAVPGPPSSPTLLRATSDSINMTFSPPSPLGNGVTVLNYVLERSTVSSTTGFATENLAQPNPSPLTYRYITGLQPGTTQYFRISAVTNVGTTTSSTPATMYTLTRPPGRPVRQSATTTSITVVFTEPVPAGTAPVTSYVLQASSVSASSGFVDQELPDGVSPTSLTRTVRNLSAGFRYWIRVAAVNAGGQSLFSEVGEISTLALGVAPGIPFRSPNEFSTFDSMVVEFAAPADNPAVLNYRLEYTEDSLFNSNVLVLPGVSTALSRQVTGLKHNTRYYFRVAAEVLGGRSPFSAVSAGLSTAPLAPTNPQRVSSTTNSLTVQYSPPPVGGGVFVNNYVLEYSTVSASEGYRRLMDVRVSTSLTRTIPGLGSNMQVFVRVQASNNGGFSPYSNTSTLATLPGPPLGLTYGVTDGTRGRLSLRITPPSGTAPLLEYAVRFRQANRNTGTSEVIVEGSSAGTAQPIRDITGLEINDFYHVQVAAVNQAGRGEFGQEVLLATPAESPSKPFVFGVPTSSSFAVTFEAPLGVVPVLRYLLELSRFPDLADAVLVEGVKSSRQITISGLHGDTVYYTRVASVNEGGRSPWSIRSDAIRTQAGPPSPPENPPVTVVPSRRILVREDSFSALSIQWAPSTFSGGSPITGYRCRLVLSSQDFVGVVSSPKVVEVPSEETSLSVSIETLKEMLRELRSSFPQLRRSSAVNSDPSPWRLQGSVNRNGTNVGGNSSEGAFGDAPPQIYVLASSVAADSSLGQGLFGLDSTTELDLGPLAASVDDSGSDTNVALIVGLAVGIPLAILAGVLIFLAVRHQRRMRRKRVTGLVKDLHESVLLGVLPAVGTDSISTTIFPSSIGSSGSTEQTQLGTDHLVGGRFDFHKLRAVMRERGSFVLSSVLHSMVLMVPVLDKFYGDHYRLPFIDSLVRRRGFERVQRQKQLEMLSHLDGDETGESSLGSEVFPAFNPYLGVLEEEMLEQLEEQGNYDEEDAEVARRLAVPNRLRTPEPSPSADGNGQLLRTGSRQRRQEDMDAGITRDEDEGSIASGFMTPLPPRLPSGRSLSRSALDRNMTPQPPLPPQPAPSTPYYHRSASVLGGRVLYPSSSGGGNRSTPQPDRRSGVGGPPPTTMLSSSLHTDSSTKGRPQHQDTADSPSLSPPSRPLPPAVRGSDPHFIPSQQTSPDEFRGPSFRASLHRPQTSMSTSHGGQLPRTGSTTNQLLWNSRAQPSRPQTAASARNRELARVMSARAAWKTPDPM